MTHVKLKACRLTAPGRGAVAVIALRGELSLFDPFWTAANGKPIQSQLIDRVNYGEWSDPSTDDPAEDIVVVRLGETDAEIQCHGGDAAVERILGQLEKQGAITVPQVEWQENPHGDETSHNWEHDCTLALTRATTDRTAEWLLRILHGLPSKLTALESAANEDAVVEIENMLQLGDFGFHLTEPWNVVLCGRPNVGKSSLINALVGFDRSVVFDQPGTTRDVVTATTAVNGWPIQFSDTAGLRDADEALELAGIELALRQLEEAELIVHVMDATDPHSGEDQALFEREFEFDGAPKVAVWNKCDLLDKRKLPVTDIAVSAKTGFGIETLLIAIQQELVPCEPDETELFPVSAKQVSFLYNIIEKLNNSTS